MARNEVVIPDMAGGLSFNPKEVFSAEELNYMNAYVHIARPDEYFFVNPKLAIQQRRKEYEDLKRSNSQKDVYSLEYINRLLELNNIYKVYNDYEEEQDMDKKGQEPMAPSETIQGEKQDGNTGSRVWLKGKKLLVYFDIMGFRAKMYDLGHEEMLKKISDLREAWENTMKPLKAGDRIMMTQFSDTILLVANGVSEKHFNLITKASIRIIQCSLQNGFAIKGVMTQGEFAVNSNHQIYFGRPLVDAYENFEDVHFYSVLVHHTAEKTIKQYASDANPYFEGDVPLKGSKPKHCYLGWWMLDNMLGSGDNRKMAKEWISELEMNASGKVRMYMKNTYDLVDNRKRIIIQGNQVKDVKDTQKKLTKSNNGRKNIKINEKRKMTI